MPVLAVEARVEEEGVVLGLVRVLEVLIRVDEAPTLVEV